MIWLSCLVLLGLAALQIAAAVARESDVLSPEGVAEGVFHPQVAVRDVPEDKTLVSTGQPSDPWGRQIGRCHYQASGYRAPYMFKEDVDTFVYQNIQRLYFAVGSARLRLCLSVVPKK